LFFLDSADRLALVGSTGIKGIEDDYGSVSYALGQGKTGWIAANGKPVRLVARDGPREDRENELNGYAGLNEVHQYAEDVLPGEDQKKLSFLGVPIISGNRVSGVLRVTGRVDGLDFTPADQTILETVAFEIGTALQIERGRQG
jgi:signal transduction protein with GAF and PtsI domain